MLALVLEYSKPMMLFLLIGTVVVLSRFGGRRSFSSVRSRESGDQVL